MGLYDAGIGACNEVQVPMYVMAVLTVSNDRHAPSGHIL